MGKLHPTNIQWCTHTVNPVVAVDRATGKQGWACTKVATGCMHCYAEALNVGRYGTGHPFDVASESLVEWRLDEAALDSVLRRRKPATIFWGDMTDLFHERVPDAWLDRIFATMALTPHLRHLVLTKRPERMGSYLPTTDTAAIWVREGMWPLPNVALGTSVSNQDDDRNIIALEECPAALRFVSYEPAFAVFDWNRFLAFNLPPLPIDCIIIGGESGPKARPFDLAWARSTIAQCEAAGVVAMVKQVGARPTGEWGSSHQPFMGGHWMLRDSHGGDPSEWPEDLRPYAASPERWPWPW